MNGGSGSGVCAATRRDRSRVLSTTIRFGIVLPSVMSHFPARSRPPPAPSNRKTLIPRRSLSLPLRSGVLLAAMHLVLHPCLGMPVVATAAVAQIGAPRDGGRFTNAARRPWPGPQVTLPFFLRKAWTSVVGRAGGARLVLYDPAALLDNPGITW